MESRAPPDCGEGGGVGADCCVGSEIAAACFCRAGIPYCGRAKFTGSREK